MKKKNLFIFILIVLIILSVFGGIFYYGVEEVVQIEVKEISILQQNFEIDSFNNKNENNQTETNSNSNEEKDENSKNNSTNTNNSNNSSGYGTSTYVSSGTVVAKIRIPRTGVNLTIYSEMTVKNMEKGVVIFSTDNGLNEVGNTVISGHNMVNGRLFSRNDRIQIGDLIYVTDPSGRKLTYSVYKKYITSPNDASYIERDTDGDTEISLSTCTNDGTQRIIIWACAL